MTPANCRGYQLHFTTGCILQLLLNNKESRSHCWRSVGGRWAVKFSRQYRPHYIKMEDFTMLGYTAYQLSIVGPFALVCFFGAAVMWFSGIR